MEERAKRGGKTAGEKKVALRIAREVLDCDSSILSLLVTNVKGEVLAVGRSGRLRSSDYLDDDILPKLGVVSKLIMGAADQESHLLGRMEFLIGAFKNQKIVLIDVPERGLSLALRMSRSSIAEYVCNKIAVILSRIE
jgi:hypothetical protein